MNNEKLYLLKVLFNKKKIIMDKMMSLKRECEEEHHFRPPTALDLLNANNKNAKIKEAIDFHKWVKRYYRSDSLTVISWI